MALPTSSLALSQVNTALGLPSTATINLNDPKVKSFAGINGPTVSMSQLLGKSLTWISRAYIGTATFFNQQLSCSSDGTALFRAASETTGYSTPTAFVQKLFLDGTVAAQFRIANATSSIFIGKIVQAPAGNVWVATNSYAASMTPGNIVKFNSALEYQSAWVISSNRGIRDIAFAPDESFTTSIVTYGYFDDYSIAKYSASGTGLWSYQFGMFPPGYMSVDSSGNTYVTQPEYNFYSGASKPTLIKFNPAGAVLWKNSIQSNATFVGVVAVPDTNQAITYGATGNEDFPGFISFSSSSGAFQWCKRISILFPGPWATYGVSLNAGTLGADGFLYFLGSSAVYYNEYQGRQIASIIKISTAGVLQWVRSFEFVNFTYKEIFSGGTASISVQNNTINFTCSSNISFSVSVPTDGSGEGTYNVGDVQMRYFTPASVTFTAFTPTLDPYGFDPILGAVPASLVTATNITVSSVSGSTTVVNI